MIIEPLPGSSIETQYSSHSTAAGRPNLKAAAAAAGHLFAARFCYLVFTLLKRLSRFPKLNLNRLGRFGPGIRPFYFGLKVGIWASRTMLLIETGPRHFGEGSAEL